MDNVFKLGYYQNHKDNGISDKLFIDSGVNFVVCSPDEKNKSVQEYANEARELAAEYHNAGLPFLVHAESSNWREHGIGKDGHDWYNCGEDAHRLNFPPEIIRAFSSVPECLGIMHDEMEHSFINRNLSIALASKMKKHPLFFPLCKTRDVKEAEQYYEERFRNYAGGFLKSGSPRFMGEHVFPVLFHLFARVGITPNYKQQKESYSNIQAVIAGGAALEYKTELWTCIDMWFRLTYPGHSAEELESNLLFSYLFGNDYSYVEGSNSFFEKDSELPEYNDCGKAFIRFSNEYAGKDRGYSIRDYRPRIGIIRLDDTFWGQGDPIVWQPILFGNPRIKPDRRAREWLRALHLITFGESSKRGLSWDKFDVWSLRKHRSFCSMNSPAVFDDIVGKETLESLELCFLCGYHICDETLSAICGLVRDKGLTVVTPNRFAPEHIKAKAGLFQKEIPDGKGRWIVTHNPCSRFVKKRVRQLLGKKGEMSFRFKDREIRMEITENGDTFNVSNEISLVKSK